MKERLSGLPLSLCLLVSMAAPSIVSGAPEHQARKAAAVPSAWAGYNRAGDDALIKYFSRPRPDKAELKTAERNFKEAAEQLRHSGRKDIRLAVSLRKLSAVLREQGKFEEARAVMKEYRTTFGPACPDCKTKTAVVPVVRGEKALKDYQLEIKNGEVVALGLEPGSEQWHCKRCKHSFQPAVKLPPLAPRKALSPATRK